MDMLFQESSHRRWNPLKREWVLVSPHRTQRPWQGQTEDSVVSSTLKYDPQCYLCPGNKRAGGEWNPRYTGTYAFANDFAALKPDVRQATMDYDGAGLLQAETESGFCRVLCFSPRHDLTLATMTVTDIRRVVELWTAQIDEFSRHDDIGYVQIFENHGAMMGASNPHPHGQVWATRHLPNEPANELLSQRDYHNARGTGLLSTYLQIELARGERIIARNETWVALVPFWAVWPFETMLLPIRPIATLQALTERERDDLAAMLKMITAGYNRIFGAPFPYSMGLHPAPTDNQDHPEWQLHIHFFPPLLRSASIRKFMVGFEMLGSPQRDTTAESAAETLRRVLVPHTA